MDDSIKISNKATTHHNLISADGTVKFDFMTSLQNIAIAKIVTILWMNVETIEGRIIKPPFAYFMGKKEWERFENNIVAKISHLHVPNILSQKMTHVVKHLGNSVISWVCYHNRYVFDRKDSNYCAHNLMNNITWMARGQIDYQQTAKNIFANQNILLDDKSKCRLACNYCLEDEIELLAPKILEMFDDVDGDSEPMVHFWMKHIKGELNSRSSLRHNNISFNEYIMQRLICDDWGFRNSRRYNDVPIRFMWSRLSDEEKERNITFFVNCIENKDYLFSLLSNLCYHRQQNVFKKCAEHVLQCMFNDWLWGEYFLPTTFIVLQSLEFDKPLKYWQVLTNVIYKLCISSTDVKKCMRDEYKSVFKRLWRETSIECKDNIIQLNGEYSIEWFLAETLSWERDMDIAEAILKDLTVVQKKNIAFGEYSVECCIEFIKNDRWDVLELFLKHTLSTQEDISFLKKKLVKNSQVYFKYESFDKVEHFLKWVFDTEDEREKYRQTLRKKRKHLHIFSEKFPH